MIHRDNIINSPRSTKNSIATDIRKNLARYRPREDFFCSGPLRKQLIDAKYIDASDRPRRRQLEIILGIIMSA